MSLTSPRVKRIRSSQNFRSPSWKDFCNKIPSRADVSGHPGRSVSCQFSAQVRTNDYKHENDNIALSEPHLRRQTMVQTSDKSTIAIPRVATFHTSDRRRNTPAAYKAR